MNKNKAVVLGGTNSHIELIKDLKRRGYFTILIDYYETPPAKKHADIHIQESTMDFNKVLEICQKEKINLIISSSVDQANLTACFVAEKLNLPIPYSYKTALEVTDKSIMKFKMTKAGIPTSKYITLSKQSKKQDIGQLNFPVMVKPADNCGSAGVNKANNYEELSLHLNTAYEASRGGMAIVEDFIEGKEISVYAFIHSGQAEIIMISERHSTVGGEKNILMCYATTTTPVISESAMQKIKEASNSIASSFSLDNTPLHVQAFVNGNDINIIEFAPRVGGGVSYKTIMMKTGFNIISATVDSFLGNKVIPKIINNHMFYSINIIYAKSGILGKVSGLKEFVELGEIEEINFYKNEGSLITDNKASSGRVFNFIVKSHNYHSMVEKVRNIYKKIKIKDLSNNSDILMKGMNI